MQSFYLYSSSSSGVLTTNASLETIVNVLNEDIEQVREWLFYNGYKVSLSCYGVENPVGIPNMTSIDVDFHLSKRK
jgi:hypothetical protein